MTHFILYNQPERLVVEEVDKFSGFSLGKMFITLTRSLLLRLNSRIEFLPGDRL